MNSDIPEKKYSTAESIFGWLIIAAILFGAYKLFFEEETGESWILIENNQEGIMKYDKNSVRKDGELVILKIRATVPPAEHINQLRNKAGMPLMVSMNVLFRFDCGGRKIQMIQQQWLFNDGSEEQVPDTPFEIIMPNSGFEVAMNYACRSGFRRFVDSVKQKISG